jgi:hypothetical protein
MTAVAWAAIGLLAAALFGALFYLGAVIDALGARLDGRLDGVASRIDSLAARIDALGARLDAHVEQHSR